MSVEDNKEVKEKKSKKKLITVSSIGVLIPLIIAIMYVMNPAPSETTDVITINDFPLEKFVDGYDILCNKYPDKSRACLVKKDGSVILTLLENGIYKFQTADYSLMKGWMSDVGMEEISISYAFYADGTSVRIIDGGNFPMWIVIPSWRQANIENIWATTEGTI